MDEKHNNIINYLHPSIYVTAKELALQFNVSIKTIRLRIKTVNLFLNGNGAKIESKPNHGYRLIITNEKLFKHFLEVNEQKEVGKIPTVPVKREKFIIQNLLFSKKYVKIEQFCDMLFVSRSTISYDIQNVEEILKKFDLKLIRKPYYGIQIFGNEANKRNYLINFYKNIKNNQEEITSKQSSNLMRIEAILLETLNHFDLDISNAAFESLLVGLFVAESRITLGFNIDINGDEKQLHIDEYILMIAEDIANKIHEQCGAIFSIEEIKYIGLLISGLCQVSENRVEIIPISDEIQQLADEMLEKIFSGLGLDFRSNLDLRILLCQQLVPFDIRMKYNIPLDNPYLEGIRTSYKYAYIISSQACVALSEHYQKKVSDDEIGNFALLFKLMLEKKDRAKKKKNIILICASGKVSAQLLATMYKKEFGENINIIKICDLYSLKISDFDDMDCVFTTVPIPFRVTKPVFHVDLFLGDNEIKKIRDILESEKSEELETYYRKDLFFNNIHANNRTAVIQEMCDRIKNVIPLKDDFQESVLKREEMLSTDYGNLVAFPHPCVPFTEETFVSVGILDKPLLWKQNEVQVIILVSISKTKNSEKELHQFYESTIKLITNKNAINSLITTRSYDLLIDLLSMNSIL